MNDMEKLEATVLSAKEAYQADPLNERLKLKHRKASQALADARSESRGGIPEKNPRPEDAAVSPESVNGTGTPGKVN
jgi:hypothetical protein